jgi:hypothetical protein
MNTTIDQLHVPAGSTRVSEWENEKVRSFYGTSREVEVEHGKILIELEGEQLADGSVLRFLYVSGSKSGLEGPTDGPMSFEDAGKFGAALIAASDEQARWAELDGLSDPESTIKP